MAGFSSWEELDKICDALIMKGRNKNNNKHTLFVSPSEKKDMLNWANRLHGHLDGDKEVTQIDVINYRGFEFLIKEA